MLIRFVLILLTFSVLSADGIRYLDEVFESVQKTEDVVYGNAPDLPFWFWVESNTVDIDLDMDVYEPVGDTETNRPVIIFAHTGSFFSGHNELDDVVDGILKVAFTPGACNLPDGVERFRHMGPTLTSETGVAFVRPTEAPDSKDHERCDGRSRRRESD